MRRRRLTLLTLLTLACSPSGGGLDERSGPGGGARSGSGGNGTSSSGAGGDDGTVVLPIGGNGGNPSGIDPGASCGSETLNTSVETVIEPGNVLIVFDQSDSMDGDFNGMPKWQAATSALTQALTPSQNALTIGALVFPTPGADWSCITFVLPCGASCVAPMGDPAHFPFQPGPQFLQAWQQRWQSPGLVTSTPLDAALVQADAYLKSVTLTGETAVIVVTDGEPTCNQAPGSVALAQDWLQQGIKTFVIGLPGALGATVLTDLAVAGGTNQFLTPADAAALEGEIANITSTVVRQSLNDCGVVFNEVPEDVSEIALVVTDAQTGDQFRVEQGPEGWQLAADGTSADLMGLTCTEALDGRFSTIAFEFGCQDVPILR